MGWIKTDIDLRQPLVTLLIRDHQRSCTALLEDAMQSFRECPTSLALALEAWIERQTHDQYPGLAVLGIHYDYQRCLWALTLCHAAFPRTSGLLVLPEWTLRSRLDLDGVATYQLMPLTEEPA